MTQEKKTVKLPMNHAGERLVLPWISIYIRTGQKMG